MRGLVSVALVVGLLAWASREFYPAAADRENRLAAVTRIFTSPRLQPESAATQPEPLPPAAFIPAGSLRPAEAAPIAATPATATTPQQTADATTAEPAVAMPTAAPADEAKSRTAAASPVAPATPPTWATEVIGDDGQKAPTGAMSSTTPGDSGARYELVVKLQRELKRMGCYTGAADGSWGKGSKRAMRAFMDSVNASLPLDQPDYIQLRLLEGQRQAACSGECPVGQTRSGDGRCVPNAIIARAERTSPQRLRSSQQVAAQAKPTTPVAPEARKSEEASSGWTALETAALPSGRSREPIPGRMSVGGPVAAPASGAVSSRTEDVAGKAPAVAERSLTSDASAAGTGSAEERVAALSTDTDTGADDATPVGTGVSGPRGVTAPPEPRRQARGAKPRATYFAPRAAYRPPPQRARYSSYRPARGIQSLFTHPLGRM